MVNTFVTTTDLVQNAKNLDYKRIGKQRLEARQIIAILEALDNSKQLDTKGWIEHPATKMWHGYTNALKVYFNVIVREWIQRGYVNNMQLYDIDESKYYVNPYIGNGMFQYQFTEYSFPPWFGYPPFIMAHRAALWRKNPVYYAKFNSPELQPYINIGYLWPSKHGNEIYTNLTLAHFDPIGTGAPAQYRITKDQCMIWIQNPYVNPSTGRSISNTGALFKDYMEASKHYGLIS